MRWTNRFRYVKVVLILAAILISFISLAISHFLAKDLAKEEKLRMEVWAEAMRSLNAADEYTDLSLVLKVINENHTIPVVVLDQRDSALMWRNVNISSGTEPDSVMLVSDMGKNFKAKGNFIRINLSVADSTVEATRTDYVDVCYGVSSLLRRITVYPYVQLVVVVVFILVVLFALLVLKRAEQDRVWVGLSRETAHQLGTPISSLMAWIELLKETDVDNPILSDMENDVNRLQLVADRFSKIGSLPEVEPCSLTELVQHVVDYMRQRSPAHLRWIMSCPATDIVLPLNRPLFEWALENLVKNAVDAMGGANGCITIAVKETGGCVFVDVIDTGGGIKKQNLKHVFSPGFTTKQRGWGLGLSLTKRIIETYHHGRIWVSRSEEGVGTTIRVMLKKGGGTASFPFRHFYKWGSVAR
ncbi:HAMP domain-containing histidine kinase [Prevotella sp. A2931]|uniref:histidine kinase n=1 Tax=Prevotella illustrans TaxID=2800387 RepID=A0ABS3M6R3_9BACT|nr:MULTISPECIES: HAMP domain-containing sensor histidine kinase [Prevotella]MBO1363824.1 HAMP domain-containing histidine kinase [Prevotella illustrans]PTL27088.1 ATP-binding protein [Prevotella sp. oral taxon 820]